MVWMPWVWFMAKRPTCRPNTATSIPSEMATTPSRAASSSTLARSWAGVAPTLASWPSIRVRRSSESQNPPRIISAVPASKTHSSSFTAAIATSANSL